MGALLSKTSLPLSKKKKKKRRREKKKEIKAEKVATAGTKTIKKYFKKIEKLKVGDGMNT